MKLQNIYLFWNGDFGLEIGCFEAGVSEPLKLQIYFTSLYTFIVITLKLVILYYFYFSK